MNTDTQPVQILLVEDNDTDVMIAREALRFSTVANELHVVEDGEEAIKYLRRQPPYERAARPDLVLLDLNLPKKGGREVLAEVKTDPTLLQIPIVILSTSKADEDVYAAYSLHANSYVAKPLDFAAFGHILLTLEQFWLCMVILPKARP